MIDYEIILKKEPYSLSKDEKEVFLTEILSELTERHYHNCPEYKKILNALSFNINNIKSYYDIPFLPVRLFKEYSLKSIKDEEVIKTMTSSGTTGQQVSKIYLDKQTSANQTKTLANIISSFLGNKRLPMIVLDTSAVIKNRNLFSARGAGILGFSMFARDRIFALDENMNLDTDGIKAFLEKHKDDNIILFGFTFMVWQHFYRELKKTGFSPDLSKGTLIHGGGWKKLINEAVSPEYFKSELKFASGLERIHDYYGMVEQTGSIYMECEEGYLHAPIFSDVIMRRHKDFYPCGKGEEGIIEVVSVLPQSYPGHALLTEDSGVIIGEDGCKCGRKGKYFKITGRIKNAEIRGCSDTYAAGF